VSSCHADYATTGTCCVILHLRLWSHPIAKENNYMRKYPRGKTRALNRVPVFVTFVSSKAWSPQANSIDWPNDCSHLFASTKASRTRERVSTSSIDTTDFKHTRILSRFCNSVNVVVSGCSWTNWSIIVECEENNKLWLGEVNSYNYNHLRLRDYAIVERPLEILPRLF